MINGKKVIEIKSTAQRKNRNNSKEGIDFKISNQLFRHYNITHKATTAFLFIL